MNWDRFCAANSIALVTHTLTQPLDLVKVRSQVLQEGKPFTGIGWQRGFHPFNLFDEIYGAGGGLRKMFTGLDGFAARTLGYTTARVWGFCYFYDILNPDPRRTARADWYIMAGMAGGLVAGVVSNPIELVFARMQVDEVYPENYRRNYKSFADGMMKVVDEGVLFRGALANGLRIGALACSMTGVYDWCKENSYFFLGPSWINRLWATAAAVGAGTLASMPFDAIRLRMHTMRPMPTGRMPYNSSWDCFKKIMYYESSSRHQSNPGGSFYAGGQAYYMRLFAICYLSQFILDYYHGGSNVSEFWQPARFNFQSGLDYDIHEPFTDGFNKFMMSKWTTKDDETAEYHPDGKTEINVV